jgi:hypothetical protein
VRQFLSLRRYKYHQGRKRPFPDGVNAVPPVTVVHSRV